MKTLDGNVATSDSDDLVSVGVKVLVNADGSNETTIKALIGASSAFNPYTAGFSLVTGILGAIDTAQRKAWEDQASAKLDAILRMQSQILAKQEEILRNIAEVAPVIIENLSKRDAIRLSSALTTIYEPIVLHWRDKKFSKWSEAEKNALPIERNKLAEATYALGENYGIPAFQVFIAAALAVRNLAIFTDYDRYYVNLYSSIADKMTVWLGDRKGQLQFSINECVAKMEKYRAEYRDEDNRVKNGRVLTCYLNGTAPGGGASWDYELGPGTIEAPIKLGNRFTRIDGGLPYCIENQMSQLRANVAASQAKFDALVASFRTEAETLKNLEYIKQQVIIYIPLFRSWAKLYFNQPLQDSISPYSRKVAAVARKEKADEFSFRTNGPKKPKGSRAAALRK